MEQFNLDIKNLASLLKNPNEENESDEDSDKPEGSLTSKIGPGHIGPAKKGNNEEKKSIYEKKTNSKDIWDVNEVEEGGEFDTSDDPRIQPDYEIHYKQKVSAEDIFLQMGNKTPATSSCEEMVVKINLPGVGKISEIDVNLYDKFLDCRTNKYRLGLHLPHPVKSKDGTAKWDSKKTCLIITMPMDREFDFVNL